MEISLMHIVILLAIMLLSSAASALLMLFAYRLAVWVDKKATGWLDRRVHLRHDVRGTYLGDWCDTCGNWVKAQVVILNSALYDEMAKVDAELAKEERARNIKAAARADYDNDAEAMLPAQRAKTFRDYSF